MVGIIKLFIPILGMTDGKFVGLSVGVMVTRPRPPLVGNEVSSTSRVTVFKDTHRVGMTDSLMVKWT